MVRYHKLLALQAFHLLFKACHLQQCRHFLLRDALPLERRRTSGMIQHMECAVLGRSDGRGWMRRGRERPEHMLNCRGGLRMMKLRRSCWEGDCGSATPSCATFESSPR